MADNEVMARVRIYILRDLLYVFASIPCRSLFNEQQDLKSRQCILFFKNILFEKHKRQINKRK